MFKDLKMKWLSFIHKGKNIVYYQISNKHPMIGKRYFGENLGFFTVERIYNVKTLSTCCSGFQYEKDERISWTWKVKIRTDEGIYILPMSYILSTSTNENGSKIDDSKIFIFYK